MANNIDFEIKHHEILLVVGVLLFLLFSYFGYLFYVVKADSTEQKLTLNSQNNSQIKLDECANLDGEIKKSCLIKIAVCSDDQCYYNQARLTKNESECFFIKDENLRLGCSASVSYDGILQGAVTNNDVSICDKLEGNGRVSCLNNYYYVKAVNNKDKTLCEKIVTESVKNECLQN